MQSPTHFFEDACQRVLTEAGLASCRKVDIEKKLQEMPQKIAEYRVRSRLMSAACTVRLLLMAGCRQIKLYHVILTCRSLESSKKARCWTV